MPLIIFDMPTKIAEILVFLNLSTWQSKFDS